MAADSPANAGRSGSLLEIAVLGELLLRRGDLVLQRPTRRPATILIILALAEKSVDVHDLCRIMGSTRNTVEKHVSNLKKVYYIPIETVDPRGRTRYRLDPSQCQVDAHLFTSGVRRLDESTEPTAIDALLALWRGDPRTEHAGVPRGNWDQILADRDVLIAAIERIEQAERLALTHLEAFAEHFSADRLVDPIRPQQCRTHRKRLLIVEDQVAETIIGLLEEDYDCEPVESFEAWKMFKKTKLREREIHGALIDLHLRGADDALGMHIVKYLQDFTEIPVAVVTSNAEVHTTSGKYQMLAEYRLVDIVDKDDRDRYLRDIPETVQLLVGEDDFSRRRRMETWRRAAFRRVERETAESTGGPVMAGRWAECKRQARTVEQLIRDGGLDEAQRAVDDFCRQWAPLAH